MGRYMNRKSINKERIPKFSRHLPRMATIISNILKYNIDAQYLTAKKELDWICSLSGHNENHARNLEQVACGESTNSSLLQPNYVYMLWLIIEHTISIRPERRVDIWGDRVAFYFLFKQRFTVITENFRRLKCTSVNAEPHRLPVQL